MSQSKKFNMQGETQNKINILTLYITYLFSITYPLTSYYLPTYLDIIFN